MHVQENLEFSWSIDYVMNKWYIDEASLGRAYTKFELTKQYGELVLGNRFSLSLQIMFSLRSLEMLFKSYPCVMCQPADFVKENRRTEQNSISLSISVK